MPVKQSVDDIARSYAVLQEHLPGIEIDPRAWSPKALEVLSAMAKTGPVFRKIATHLITQDIQLYTTLEAKGVSAGWHENIFGECWISIARGIGFIHSLIVIGHETHHLQQTIRTRCSVEGEYSAWRFAYQLREELTAAGTALPLTDDEQQLASMPDHPTREDLKTAQALIQKMAGPDYLIGKTPLQGKDWQTALIAPAVQLINSVMGRGTLL
jgi:hypothetical protein